MLRRPRRSRAGRLLPGLCALLGLGAWLLALAARWPGVRRGPPGLAEASAAATAAACDSCGSPPVEGEDSEGARDEEEAPPQPRPAPPLAVETPPEAHGREEGGGRHPAHDQDAENGRASRQTSGQAAHDPDPDGDEGDEIEGHGGLTALVLGLLALGRGLLAVWAGEQESLRAVRLFQRARRIAVQHASAGLEPANQGRLVHVQGLTATAETLRDPLFGVEVKDTLKLRRKVEMFQWTEHAEVSVRDLPGGGKEQATTYSYSAGWHPSPVESWRFQGNQGPRHSNPQMPFISEELWAKEATLGKFRLPARLVGQVSNFSPCTELATTSAELPAEHGGLKFTQALVEGIPYLVSRSTTAPPEIGDLRVRFERVPCEEVSVVAAQEDDAFRPMTSTDRIDSEGRICFDEDPNVEACGCLSCLCCLPGSRGGRTVEQQEEVFMIAPGRRTARQMLWAAEGTMPRPRSWPNLSGLFCIVLGLSLFGTVLPGLFQVIPYAGGLVGSLGLPGVWATALALGAVLGYCIAALAWFQARPCRTLLWLAALGLVFSVPYLYGYWQMDAEASS